MFTHTQLALRIEDRIEDPAALSKTKVLLSLVSF